MPNAQVVKVNSKKLSDWLSLISEDGITKVYLHFCYEDYTPGLRAEIHTALRKNPNLRIICQYENNPRTDIEKKAKFTAVKHKEIGVDIIKPGYEVPSDKFVAVVAQAKNDREHTRDPQVLEKNLKIVSEVEKTLEENKHKITDLSYGKFSVGGNDSLRSDKVTRNEDLDSRDNFIARREQDIPIPHNNPEPTLDKLANIFKSKSEEFKEKRRRKKKE